jgi:hypothetical protein
MDQRHQEHSHYQFEEQVVIALANTIVKPPAMMVESAGAPVASAAMLRRMQDMRLAHFAHILVTSSIKSNT